ncbi:MAG: 1-acyl-sn-glycerol-3-phosphate acyltransferase [Clostridia bacterium]|nr:1-acyl-sn-glycerol-3-phosphate acyltransferase [Clostridia bacterium]
MKLNVFKRFILRIASCVYPVKIFNKENLPQENCVIVCNHFSVIDCLYLAILNKRQNYLILAKKEALKSNVYGKILKGYGAIPIDREKPDLRTLIDLIKFLKNGNNKLLIFPEGTRNKTGTIDIQPLKEGAGVFALKAKCKILPIIIWKKARIFRRNKMIVGTPFELCDFYDKKGNEQDQGKITQLIYDKMVEEQKNLLKLTTKRVKNESNNRKK